MTSFVCENLKWERGWGDPELKKTLSKTLSFRCLRRKRLKEALSFIAYKSLLPEITRKFDHHD